MRVVVSALAFAVSLLIVGDLLAAEEQKRPHPNRPMGSMMILDRLETIKGLNLTSEQKVKMEALKKEYGSKLKDARKKADDILTADQKKARAEAMKAARAAENKKIRETREGIQTAMKLTDEQKTKMDEARKAMGDLNREVREKVMDILTPEQKELMKKERGQKRDRMAPAK